MRLMLATSAMLACAAAFLAAAPIAAEAGPPAAGIGASQARPAELVEPAGGKHRRYGRLRDCKPFNGPYGYYGNPWCERGWKYAEDRADMGYWVVPRFRYWRR